MTVGTKTTLVVSYFRLISSNIIKFILRQKATEGVLPGGNPPVGCVVTEGVISGGYPPVGSGATKGVLSEGYMLVCPDQVSPQTALCPQPSLQKTWRKKMAATFARFTQLLMIEFPYRRRSMGPMRLYTLACLSGSSLACKSGISPPLPTNIAADFKIIKLYLLFVLCLLTKLYITLINSTL